MTRCISSREWFLSFSSTHLQHRHAAKSLTESYNHIIHSFSFGNSTDLSHQSLQETKETSNRESLFLFSFQILIIRIF